MKSVWREGRKGALGMRFMPTCLKLFRSLFFSSQERAESCGMDISRKEGWDAQSKGEKGEVQRIQPHIVEDGRGRQ